MQNLVDIIKLLIFAPVKQNAEIAQLVEHNLAKVRGHEFESRFPLSRVEDAPNGGIGRHEGLKIPWPLRLCGFKSRFEYKSNPLIACKSKSCRRFSLLLKLFSLLNNQ